jgi:diketogulonate reductase-like aldo/keto reductase
MVAESQMQRVKATSTVPAIELILGVSMPLLGYGVGTAFFRGSRGEDQTIEAITMALDAGLLHIDEAESYQNEAVTGKAVRAWFATSGTPRSDVFFTGKVLGSIDGLPGWSDSIEASCRNSIEKLGINYFDLYLLHAPFNGGEDNVPFKRSLPQVWSEMEALVEKGLTKAIGVSNWRKKDLEQIFDSAVIKPCMNQIENHPHLRQPLLIEYCQSKGIAVASYGGLKPVTDKNLAKTRLMTEVLPRIASAHGKTITQILQRWNSQSSPAGRKIVITTTQQASRLQESLDAFGGSWQLSAADMAAIDAAGDEHFHRAFWNSKLDEE